MTNFLLSCCHPINFSNDNSTLLEKLLPTFIGALLSGLVAIWIFYEGQKRQKIRDAEKEKARLIELEGRINHIIFSLIEPLQKQINLYGGFIKQLRKSGKELMSLKKNALLASLVESFYEESHSDLYNIYISSKKGALTDKSNKLNLINKNFYILKSSFSIVDEEYKRSAISLGNRIKEFEDCRRAIYIFIKKNVSENVIKNKTPQDDPFMAELSTLWRNFTPQNNNTYLAAKFLFRPIEDLCSKFLNDARAIELSLEINKALIAEYAVREAKYRLCLFLINQIRSIKAVKIDFEKLLKEAS